MILDNIIRFRERIFESVRRAYQTFSSYLFRRSYFSSLAFVNSKRSNLEGLIDNYFDRRVRDAFDYVKELDRKPHPKGCGGSLSIQKTSACHKPHPLGCGGTSFF